MDVEKAQEDLRASIEILTDSLNLYHQGRVAHYRVITGELWKLLGDRNAMMPRLFPKIKLHPLKGNSPTESRDSSQLNQIRSILGPSHFMIPGFITFDGKGGSRITTLFDENTDPIDIELWLKQKFFSNIITIRQLIKAVRDKESAHADLQYHEVLDVTRSVKLPNGYSHEKAIIAIGEYILKMILHAQASALMGEVHTCEKCNAKYSEIMPYSPVYSFGDPAGKPVILIGLNPSQKEFEYRSGKQHLSTSNDINDRRLSQLTYFERQTHKYFKKVTPFFKGPVKDSLEWSETPWEKVGVLDLVKCATVINGGQWNKLDKQQKDFFIGNCAGYLIEQLRLYRPRVILPYGVDACIWFSEWLNIHYEEYTSFEAKLEGESIRGIFIPQRQGKHSIPEIKWVQRELSHLLLFLD